MPYCPHTEPWECILLNVATPFYEMKTNDYYFKDKVQAVYSNLKNEKYFTLKSRVLSSSQFGTEQWLIATTSWTYPRRTLFPSSLT